MGRTLFTEDIVKDPKKLKEQLNVAFGEQESISPPLAKLEKKVAGLKSVTTIINQGSPSSSTIVMSESVLAFAVITSNGKKADSSNIAHINKVCGIIIENTNAGFTGTFIRNGSEVTNPAWTWTSGAVIYLNGTTLSTVAPTSGFSQRIGTAKTATTLLIELSETVLL